MAITVSTYDHTVWRFVSGANAAGDTYKLILATAATFNASHTTLAGITYTEVANGNGYTTGGKALTGVAITQVGNDAKFDADDVTWTASGGPIAASYGILVDDTDTNDPPLVLIDFGGSQSAGDGTDFKAIWPAAGIFTFTLS